MLIITRLKFVLNDIILSVYIHKMYTMYKSDKIMIKK